MKSFKLRSGNIIVTSIDGIPIFEHAGVVSIQGNTISVWHINPENGVLKEDISTFLSNRRIIEVRDKSLSEDFLSRKIDQLKNKKYDIIKFNCFDFVKAVHET